MEEFEMGTDTEAELHAEIEYWRLQWEEAISLLRTTNVPLGVLYARTGARMPSPLEMKETRKHYGER